MNPNEIEDLNSTNAIEEAETETLDDLAVENDAQIVGGDGPGSGGPVFNHNETTAEDTEAETEALDDLPVLEGQEEEINGGAPGRIIIGYGGVPNHNETTAEDDAEESGLNDLAVSNDAEIVGGMLKRIRIGGMSFGEEGGE